MEADEDIRLTPRTAVTRRFFFLSLILLPILCACAKLGPDYAGPSTSADPAPPAAWLRAEDAALSAQPDPAAGADWWKNFDDPALAAVVEEALAANPGLRASGLRVYESRARLGIAVGSLYPQSQFIDGGLDNVRPSRRAPTAGAGGPESFNQADLSLAASWELDFWGRFRRGIEAAQAETEASLADYRAAQVSVAAQTAQSYLAARVAQERLRIARENVATQREGLRIAMARFTYGATSELDARQAETLLKSTEAAIPDLENGLAQAEHALAALMGRPPEKVMARLDAGNGKPGKLVVPPLPGGVGLPADLLRRRPDVRAAERRAAAQCARIGVAAADLYPSFSLTGNVGFLASDVGGFRLDELFAHGFTASVGPGIRWNIFNYGRLTNAVRAQDAVFEASLATYETAVLAALQEAEDALSAWLRARERTALLEQSSQSAKRAVELAIFQYREGATDFTTVLTAQQSLLFQEDALATSRGSIAINLAGLYRALGGGWESRTDQPPVPADIREKMAKRTGWGGLLETPPVQHDVKMTPDW